MAGLVVCLLVAVAVLPAQAAAREIVVDRGGDGDFRTIESAVANASDGDTVIVQPGTDTGPIVIDASVDLRAAGPVELRGNLSGSAIDASGRSTAHVRADCRRTACHGRGWRPSAA